MDALQKFHTQIRLQFLSYVQWILNFVGDATEKIVLTIVGRIRPQRQRAFSTDEGIVKRRTVSETEAHLRMVFPETLHHVLVFGQELSEDGSCVGYRPKPSDPYVYLSYSEVIQRSHDFGAGLLAVGGRMESEYLVGIFAKTCVEWTLAQYACFSYGMVTAPLYDSLGHEACQGLIDTYEIEIMICGGDAQVSALYGGERFPDSLRTVITIEPLSRSLLETVRNFGLTVYNMAEVEELGRQSPQPLCLPRSDSLATLIFTSGTTGVPKAVMLTHEDVLLSLKSLLKSLLPVRFSPDDTVLGFLPLAHIFERLMELIIHLHGGKVGYLSGEIDTMFKDARDVRPTFFGFVPRLMNKFHDQVQADLNKSLLRKVLGKAGLMTKRWEMELGIFQNKTVWDRWVFRKYQKILGGRIRVALTGSAAVDSETLNFCRAILGCYIFEAYGQTESAGPITCTVYGDCSPGHVGVPFFDVEVKLVDVADLRYFAKDGKGEICVRSKFVMKGYYKMPNQTAEAIDEDHWLHTGDIGMWLPVNEIRDVFVRFDKSDFQNGNLKIFDRKKHIFKLSQGEYLAPERLEQIFQRVELITNIFVDGDSRYPFPVALVYPNYEEAGLHQDGDPEKLKQAILQELQRTGKEHKLKSYEIPKRIYILKEGFSVENDCVTPSQKTRREVVRKLYKDTLARLYDQAS